MRNFLPGFIWLFAMCIGPIGLVLVVYGFLAFHFEPWDPLEQVAPWISGILTLLGTIGIAGSVYFYNPISRPPLALSKRLISPFVILICVLTMAWIIYYRHLPSSITSGFALIAISGGLLRSHLGRAPQVSSVAKHDVPEDRPRQ